MHPGSISGVGFCPRCGGEHNLVGHEYRRLWENGLCQHEDSPEGGCPSCANYCPIVGHEFSCWFGLAKKVNVVLGRLEELSCILLSSDGPAFLQNGICSLLDNSVRYVELIKNLRIVADYCGMGFDQSMIIDIKKMVAEIRGRHDFSEFNLGLVQKLDNFFN